MLRLQKRTYRVLLAEDSAVHRAAVSAALERAGHRVTAVEDGEQAVQSMRDSAFDVVVMDIEMPRMDGVAAARAIRDVEEQKGGRVPIIALTAQSRAELGDAPLQAAGMDVYLRKPFDINVLLKTLEQAMEPVLDIFNHAELLERVGGDEELLATIVGVFRADATNMLAAVRDAIQAKNPVAVEHAAHKLKGALANLSAANAMRSAKGLEEMGRKKILDNAEAAYETLQSAMDILDTRLRAFTR